MHDETSNSLEYSFRSYYIPRRMFPAILRWIREGKPPGDFLSAIIKNDLTSACNFADDENLANLPAYVSYFYNIAPAGCWGSKEAFDYWKKKFEQAD